MWLARKPAIRKIRSDSNRETTSISKAMHLHHGQNSKIIASHLISFAFGFSFILQEVPPIDHY
jgi:hypothetical protein